MANKFVLPLPVAEILLGNVSKLIVYKKHTNNSSILHCNLNVFHCF